MNVSDWLSNTVASEVMTRDVRTLSPNDPLAHAAEVLLREQLTGAPVVDERGVCTGVLSVSDVVGAEEKVEAERRREAESSFWHSSLALPMSVYEARLAEIRDKVAPAAHQPVERFMTSDVVSIRQNTSLREAIQSMVDAHIHRVVVVDSDHRLQGIISTIDVLAALLRVGR